MRRKRRLCLNIEGEEGEDAVQPFCASSHGLDDSGRTCTEERDKKDQDGARKGLMLDVSFFVTDPKR